MTLIIDPETLEQRRAEVTRAPELAAIERRLRSHLDDVVAHPLYVPEAKALYSRWGAHCRDDGAELEFDPFAPHVQRCPTCGRTWSTEQAHRWWVYWYQLWLAERVWMLALFAGPGGDGRYEARALEALAAIVVRYPTWPNADNVLGPSRPFFSTYLESIWVLHLAAAASLLDALGRLPRRLGDDLRARVFEPSAAIIADFDEGRSNRQVWNAAALFALNRLLGNEAGQRVAATGASGVLGVLEAGLLADGLWYEGENYHWFALRGLTWGAELLREAGVVDLWADDGPAGARFQEAFRAPVLTALPDFTFPARRDAKFGVSLRQRRMAELWEMAASRLTPRRQDAEGREGYSALLRFVYDPEVPAVEESAGAITDVERWESPAGLRRDQLGWKGLLWASATLPEEAPEAWRPATVHLEATGLAIFRDHRRYVSLDYGESGGGHGHPDRLNLTLHADGVPWLVDFGTGSYAAPTLAWYRATLAHNAPLLDRLSQAEARGACLAWDDTEGYGWVCAQLAEGTAYDGATIQRTVVVTPGYVLDVVQMGSTAGERQVAVPWHGGGALAVHERGCTFARDSATLAVLLAARQPFHVEVHRGPGPPATGPGGQPSELEFPVVVSAGEEVTLASCLDTTGEVEEVGCADTDFVVRLKSGVVHVHRATDEGWMIEREHGDPIELRGLREPPEAAPEPPPAPRRALAVCRRVPQPPALDGSPDGFPAEPALVLDRADQFRRAEAPWGGPEAFSARGWLAHDGETVYLAVEVVADEPRFRPPDAPNPEWENENPDIHSDGIQLYVATIGFFGWLVVPVADDPAALRVSAVPGSDGEPEMITAGAWRWTQRGYGLTLAIALPEPPSGEIGLDLYVNRTAPGCERRAGQLVWSGARGGRLYLAGDRPLPGPLPLVTIE